jgi:Bacterial virulence factor lipase N-terminal
MSRRVILILSAAICVAFAVAVPAARGQEGVEVRFDLTDPQGGPFPADRFTVPDAGQLTGLRASLPKPDCSLRPSDCSDIDVLNTLDGFNLQPRLSIPFTGPIDPATVSSDTVFLFKLSCLITTCPGDSRVGINQVVWDPATDTLYAESDRLLDQDARYLLVVTNGIRDPSGERIDSDQFRDVLHAGETSDPAETAYRQALLAALDQLTAATGMPPGQVAAASLFTTESGTALLERIRDQLDAATPAPADFLLGTNGERTVFPRADVQSITFRRQIGASSFSNSLVSLAPLQVVPEAPDAVGTIAFGRYRSPDYENEDGVIPPVGTATRTPLVRRTNEVYFSRAPGSRTHS